MKNRGRALAVLVAVLLAGCLLGVAGLHLWQSRYPRDAGGPYASRMRGGPDRLAERLQLTSDQQTKLHAILDGSRREIEDSRLETDKKLEAIRIRTNSQITAILTEEQKKRFEQFLQEGDTRRMPSGRKGDRGRR
jgi:Spy/CpxP family protein refolding chaperone